MDLREVMLQNHILEDVLENTCCQIILKHGIMSSNQYLDRAIGIVKEKTGPLPPKKIATPLPTDYHPEMDQSEELGDDEANYYLSLNANTAMA